MAPSAIPRTQPRLGFARRNARDAAFGPTALVIMPLDYGMNAAPIDCALAKCRATTRRRKRPPRGSSAVGRVSARNGKCRLGELMNIFIEPDDEHFEGAAAGNLKALADEDKQWN